MSERRFKVSKSEDSNSYKYGDSIDDERATEKLLPSSDNGLEATPDRGKFITNKFYYFRTYLLFFNGSNRRHIRCRGLFSCYSHPHFNPAFRRVEVRFTCALSCTYPTYIEVVKG